MGKSNFGIGTVLAVLFGALVGKLLHYYVLSHLTLGQEIFIFLVLFIFFVIGYLVGRYGGKGRREKR